MWPGPTDASRLRLAAGLLLRQLEILLHHLFDKLIE